MQFAESQSEIEKIVPQVKINEPAQQNNITEPKEIVPAQYPQLSNDEIEEIILNTIPGSFLPVISDNGHIKIIYRDLDQNGYKDAFFLVVKNRENLNPNYRNLSDVSHLLKDDRKEIDYFLAVYLQLQGSMISMYRIPIGSSVVISDFSILSIKEGEIIPLGINISFQTMKGMNSEWIIFSSYNKFSLFSMTENISTHSLSYDIDGNNIIDIIDWEDGLEEGTGYETYLTWYRWNGREFREYQSTNVVRNLNGFLEQARLYLSFEQLDEFLQFSLNLNDYNEIMNSKESFSNWLNKIFRPVPGSESDNDELIDCGKIHSILFPQIFETPFSPLGTSLKICNINVRFVCSNGNTYIRTARIQMNPNPFKKPQFSFYLE
ncbi:MAG: hypothetical protein KAQ93_08770 [Spirochaetales bacterium]|nr:hypothetical protein [Spirochaetales bacterium]